jgi:Flp pilus assembly protein TadG
MQGLFRRLRGNDSALTAVEFAIILPMMVTLLLGAAEFGRLVLVTQKLQNGAFILADLAGRDQTLSEDQLDNIFIALTNLIEPFEFAESGSAIVTSVSGDSTGHADVNWQRSGAGALEATSAVGAPGEEASLPDTLSIGDGETIIVCEVFYDFVPLFGLTTSSRLIHRMAYLKPRLGTLETLLP